MGGEISDKMVDDYTRNYFTMGEDGIYYQNGLSQQDIIEEQNQI